MFTVCKFCNFEDSYTTNGDCSGCGECGAVEQGFLFLKEVEGFVVDEDSNILDHDYNIIGTFLK